MMVICCWAAKGGSGCSTVAAALARSDDDTLLVDAVGDQPALAGLTLDGKGLRDWLAAGDEVPIDALRRLEHDVGPSLRLVTRGDAQPVGGGVARGAALAGVLGASDRRVVVDCGTAPLTDDDLGHAMRGLCQTAERSLLVTRSCFLSIASAQQAPVRATGVVLVVEPGRALRRSDVESALGLPVVAQVPYDPAVARAVDAGMLLSRPPRSLRRALAAQ